MVLGRKSLVLLLAICPQYDEPTCLRPEGARLLNHLPLLRLVVAQQKAQLVVAVTEPALANSQKLWLQLFLCCFAVPGQDI